MRFLWIIAWKPTTPAADNQSAPCFDFVLIGNLPDFAFGNCFKCHISPRQGIYHRRVNVARLICIRSASSARAVCPKKENAATGFGPATAFVLPVFKRARVYHNQNLLGTRDLNSRIIKLSQRSSFIESAIGISHRRFGMIFSGRLSTMQAAGFSSVVAQHL